MNRPQRQPFAQIVNSPLKVRAAQIAAAKTDGENSPAPPKTEHFGESQRPLVNDASPEVEADKQVTGNEISNPAEKIHHQHQVVAESGDAVNNADDEAGECDATAEMLEAWGELTGFIAEAQSASGGGAVVNSVVNCQEEDASAAHDYQKPTLTKEARLLICLSMGMSMRAAARTIGCCHTTFVKRAKRDEHFAAQIEQAKQQARADPLRELYAASRKSWRAAAWLLEYLDRKQRVQVKPKGKSPRGEEERPQKAK